MHRSLRDHFLNLPPPNTHFNSDPPWGPGQALCGSDQCSLACPESRPQQVLSTYPSMHKWRLASCAGVLSLGLSGIFLIMSILPRSCRTGAHSLAPPRGRGSRPATEGPQHHSASKALKAPARRCCLKAWPGGSERQRQGLIPRRQPLGTPGPGQGGWKRWWEKGSLQLWFQEVPQPEGAWPCLPTDLIPSPRAPFLRPPQQHQPQESTTH